MRLCIYPCSGPGRALRLCESHRPSKFVTTIVRMPTWVCLDLTVPCIEPLSSPSALHPYAVCPVLCSDMLCRALPCADVDWFDAHSRFASDDHEDLLAEVDQLSRQISLQTGPWVPDPPLKFAGVLTLGAARVCHACMCSHTSVPAVQPLGKTRTDLHPTSQTECRLGKTTLGMHKGHL